MQVFADLSWLFHTERYGLIFIWLNQKTFVRISHFWVLDWVILSLLYPSGFSYLQWLDTACHLWHLTCFTSKWLTNQETSKGRFCSSWSDCHVLKFWRSLLPLFTVVSRIVCSWISVGFLDGAFVGCSFLFWKPTCASIYLMLMLEVEGCIEWQY